MSHEIVVVRDGGERPSKKPADTHPRLPNDAQATQKPGSHTIFLTRLLMLLLNYKEMHPSYTLMKIRQ